MLAPSGLKATQLTMLGAISISGTARMSELASLLALDKTTLTRNLRRLQADGLIAIATDADRRARLHDQIAALPAQSLLTGTGPELFDTLDARARRLSITRVNGASAATEA
jgi:DNA replication and repair protein RecF